MDAYLNGLDLVGERSAAAYAAQTSRRLRASDIRLAASMNRGVEPSGDAGEGLDVPAMLAGQHGKGSGDSYTPLPGVLPTKNHLDYVQKFSTASLLALGFVLLLGLAIIRPKRAGNLLARGAQRQVGL